MLSQGLQIRDREQEISGWFDSDSEADSNGWRGLGHKQVGQ